MRVYDPEGQTHDMDAVDARECIAHCGYTTEPPAAKEEEEDDSAAGKKAKK